MPKISLIIPIYNGEKYLRNCIDHILAQTFTDFEVIFVNDRTPDSSMEIIKEYAAKDKRFRIINNIINIGQGASRNKGIKAAKGEYIMFSDQDDWFEPTAFEEAYNQITKNKNDYVIFNYSNYYQETGETELIDKRIKPFEHVLDNPDIKPWEIEGKSIVSCFTWCQIYNAKFVKKNKLRFSKQRNGEDIPFYIKGFVLAKSISVINKSLYNYRVYDEQTTSRHSKRYKELFKVREEAYKAFLKSPHRKEFTEPMLIYYIRSVLYWYKRNAKDDPEIKRGYYIEMHKIYKKLREKYDIERIKDYIQYETFMDYSENSWNMKHNIIFEIPDRIKIYINKNNNTVYLVHNIFKIYKDKNNHWVYELFNILKIYKNSKGKTILKFFYLREGKK